MKKEKSGKFSKESFAFKKLKKKSRNICHLMKSRLSISPRKLSYSAICLRNYCLYLYLSENKVSFLFPPEYIDRNLFSINHRIGQFNIGLLF